jgi:zinc protease
MERGTAKHTRQQFKDELDKLGARLSVMSDTGALRVTVQAKRETLGPVIDLIGEMLREPAFPADEFELLKRERLERLEKGQTEPMALAPIALRRKLNPYPPTDVRYQPTIDEEIAQVKAVTLDEIKALYKDQVGGSVGELAVVGDFDESAARTQFDKYLKGWKSATPFVRIDRTAPTGVRGVKVEIETPDKTNALYVSGLAFGMTESDPDYPALEVGNYLLGGGTLSSRLGNRVRQKEGLSYGVASQFQASPIDKSAFFMMFAICNPTNMAKVDAAIGEELVKYVADGPSLGELNEGKTAYLEQQKVDRAKDGDLASEIVTNLYVGRTFAFTAALEKKIAALTPDEVKAAFQKFIDPKKLVIIEAGDFKKK